MYSAIFIILGILLFWLILYFIPIGLYFTAKSSGVQVSLFQLLCMRLRKSPLSSILNAYILAQNNNLKVTLEDLEALALEGGDVGKVINSMLDSKKRGENLSFRGASKSELNNL